MNEKFYLPIHSFASVTATSEEVRPMMKGVAAVEFLVVWSSSSLEGLAASFSRFIAS